MKNSYVGSAVERREDLRFVRGRGQYVDDLAPDGLLHAVILRSSVAHGRIRSIDAAAAVKIAGVHAVITARDMPGGPPRIAMRLQPLPEFKPFEQSVIADTKVRYVGEPIALVLATSMAVGEDALDRIVVDIEPLPAVSDCETSANGDRLLFAEQGTNCAMTFTAECGDAVAAFAIAPYVRREKFRTGRHYGLTMEPRGVMAEWDAATGQLTVSGAAKVPFFNRRILAKLMGLPEDAIAMVENDVGGGFGARGEFYPEDFLIPFAARQVGRPVKWIEDRRENLMAMNHARQAQVDVEIACTRDGAILALRGHADVDMGAYMRTNGAVGSRNVAQFMSGPYRIPNIDVDVTLFMTNKTPVGTYRGPGRFETDFFRERLFDMVAKDLGLDRVDFRRRNLVAESEMPYAIATINPFESKDQFDSGDYQITLDRCLTEFGWDEKSKLQGRLIDGRWHGLALGCFIEGGAAGPKETAGVTLNDDGSFTIAMGSSAVGQGVETVFAQIAADALEIPLTSIRVMHGSTTYLKEGYGSYGSRATVMGGSAVVVAAQKLLENFRALAAKELHVPPEKLTMADGQATAPDGRRLTLTDLSAHGLSAEGSFSNNSKATYTYGTALAHVAVDAKTARVEVLDYVVVDDVGRIINPHTLHGQVIGAAVQGLGGVFSEELVYDSNGQLLSGSLADYLIPVATDYPNVRAISLELHPSPNNPLGAKGAGEGGIIPVGGALANAVSNALSSLGVEIRELPLTPPRLWSLLQKATASA